MTDGSILLLQNQWEFGNGWTTPDLRLAELFQSLLGCAVPAVIKNALVINDL
jgi:hypothetical protein